MRIIVFIGLMMAAGALVAGTTLYRWVDDQGRVHYSDQKQPQAEEVVIGDPATFKSQPARPQLQRTTPAAETSATPPGEKSFAGYNSIAITAPKPQQILWNIGSILTVSFSIQPRLQTGHDVRVFYNGAEVKDWPKGSTSHQVPNVYRGTHTVSVSVVDSSGKQVATSDAVTFYVKQTSIQN